MRTFLMLLIMTQLLAMVKVLADINVHLAEIEIAVRKDMPIP